MTWIVFNYDNKYLMARFDRLTNAPTNTRIL